MKDKVSKMRRDIASMFCVICRIGEDDDDDGATRDATVGMDRIAKALWASFGFAFRHLKGPIPS